MGNRMSILSLRALAWAAAFALLPVLPAQAADVSDLLPVDQAYVLQARAPNRDRIELNWAIAPGYYLYRHRFSVQVLDPAFAASGQAALPEGEKHRDEFFGDVETYRGAVTAVQLGAADPSLASVRLKVKYQGCADLGVCYPPQTRTLSVAAGRRSAPPARPCPKPRPSASRPSPTRPGSCWCG
jgi:thiol:disulfide interchange protein